MKTQPPFPRDPFKEEVEKMFTHMTIGASVGALGMFLLFCVLCYYGVIHFCDRLFI